MGGVCHRMHMKVRGQLVELVLSSTLSLDQIQITRFTQQGFHPWSNPHRPMFLILFLMQGVELSASFMLHKCSSTGLPTPTCPARNRTLHFGKGNDGYASILQQENESLQGVWGCLLI